MSSVFIGRQPILDKNMRVFAYELRFHPTLHIGQNIQQAIVDVIVKTQEEIGFDAIVGKHAVMIKLPEGLIEQGLIPQFEADKRVVLEIPNHVSKNIEVLRNLKEIKLNGTAIALDNFLGDESSIKLVAVSDFVKVDVRQHCDAELLAFIAQIRQQDVKVIADKVETEEQFNHLKSLGFDFFQGYFFTNPLMINGAKLSGGKLTLLQLLSKINDDKTDFTELSKIIGHDVGLTHKLLVAVNHSSALVPVKVTSIADALKYMGLKRLKFWVNMLMLSRMEDAPLELLVTSLTRARFCELLSHEAGLGSDRESYFLVGLFSNLSAYFRAPIAEVIAEMPLKQELANALIHRQGLMGEALDCLEAIEQSDERIAQLHFKTLNVSQISHVFLAASAWAQQILQD